MRLLDADHSVRELKARSKVQGDAVECLAVSAAEYSVYASVLTTEFIRGTSQMQLWGLSEPNRSAPGGISLG